LLCGANGGPNLTKVQNFLFVSPLDDFDLDPHLNLDLLDFNKFSR
jgi:hypothetical protein